MDDDRAVVLSQLARALASERADAPLVQRLASACAEILHADGAALTVGFDEQDRLTVATADDASARLMQLQDVIGEGPAADVYREGTPIEGDLESRSRWPVLAQAARSELGPMRILVLPMRPGGRMMGVVTVHQSGQDPSAAIDRRRAQYLADAVGAALLRDPAWDSGVQGGAWASRAPIHQATGMVIAQLGVGPDDALALLRAHAHTEGVALMVIAQRVLSRELDFSQIDIPGNEDE
ncbi:hypothetical protein ASG73_17155 [Janibacter sp. Soil728]|uniref:GAF and ANTAR domain-containing protein n=1 Tax=Janibacter sp. Soil728 TaxID=1736393 RepID=UPI0006FDFBD0|nr:GAF and ANTAR domain-containing protein [Janibacter sp. Soil728]KRE35068.1 hypothetical protein ASG73_17155 [Janibacter sp. Soil728]